MDKISKTIAVSAVALMVFSGCRDEKELIIIDKNTPVNISALYMYGNANYTDWDYNNPTSLKQTEPHIYTFHGPLRKGQFKLGTTVGNNFQAFIHPLVDGESIGEEKITGKAFQAPRYGGNQEVWQIELDGVYNLEFNVRDHTYSAEYEGLLSDWDDPIETNCVYIVGTSIDVSWSLANAEQMIRDNQDTYIYTWTGNLMPGSLRFALNNVSWDYPALRPEKDGEPIGKENTISSERFRFTSEIDDNWEIKDRGNYTVSINLRDLTMNARYNSECDPMPIDRNVQVYLFGDATPAGWELGAGVPLELVEGSDYVFTWQGKLYPGWMLFMLDNNSWDRQIRPTVANSPIGATPVLEEFMFPNTNNTNWLVQFPGDYRITVDLRKCTLSTEYVVPETSELYVFGDACAAGWDLGRGLVMTPVPGTDQVFAWEGPLQAGWVLFSFDNNSWDKMIRPTIADSPISPESVVNEKFIYPIAESNNWLVTAPGNYRLTVDIPNRTLKAEYIMPRADKLYLYGDASKAGWTLGQGIEMLPVPGVDQVFSWEGPLNPGWFIIMLDNNSWDKIIRPTAADSPVGSAPVIDEKFIYPLNENNNWLVTTAGTYKLTIDMLNCTFNARMTAQH